ncbi:hypothetical protein FB45DRAFT_905165 [Roridomyces roridus]|uniref:Uncharacterized protein n=1 Tax=Roridomyces roridus TaxID=1738132 RepID=A0AAD7FVG3_9AGAR|nr:hypothetical protein FB45DRAFT_905165 [Roridomyces roridus]
MSPARPSTIFLVLVPCSRLWGPETARFPARSTIFHGALRNWSGLVHLRLCRGHNAHSSPTPDYADACPHANDALVCGL